MADLEKEFSIAKLSQEEMEVESAFNDLMVHFSDLANESAGEGGTFSADDVADIFDYLLEHRVVEGLAAEALVLLTDVLRDAQHGDRQTIEAKLDAMLAETTLSPAMHTLLAKFKAEPQLYSWIKLSSV